MIEIKIENTGVLDAFNRLIALGEDMRPPLAAIGELLAETAKQNFAASSGPAGRWEPNARSTIEGVLSRARGGTRKDGRINAKGAVAVSGKKPLVDTGQLADTINWQFIPDGVMVGTNRFADLFDSGAAVHQFGSRNGRIPARPFLPVTADGRLQDGVEDEITNVLRAALENALRG